MNHPWHFIYILIIVSENIVESIEILLNLSISRINDIFMDIEEAWH